MPTTRTVRLVAVTASGLSAFAAVGPARADTITTFAASGTFINGGVLSGTVTIDTTVGSLTGLDLAVNGPQPDTFDSTNSQFGFDANYPKAGTSDIFAYHNINDGVAPQIDLFIAGSTLVGYQGGILQSDTQGTTGYATTFIPVNPAVEPGIALTVGSLAAVTPLPRSATAGLGLLGLLGVAQGRRRRPLAA